MSKEHYSLRSKLFLRCPLTNETRNVFYYETSTNKPTIQINSGKIHIYYHPTKKMLDELRSTLGVEIGIAPIKHNAAKKSMCGICDIKVSQMKIDGVHKYIIVRVGGKNRIDSLNRALTLMDRIKSEYGIDLELCDKIKYDA